MRLVEKSAETILDTEQLHGLWKGVDVVGDIAIVKIPSELENNRFRIAENLLSFVPHLKVVLRQVGPVGSRFRIRRFEWLAGEKRTETVHREFGCKFKLDLERVYFSPRLCHERKRIADLVSRGERIVNFFAGVGSFSIMIAKHAKPSKVYSLDLNPLALRYHVINNALNGAREIIDVISGDADSLVSSSLVGSADRILLPLPDLAFRSLPIAKNALKNGHGIVHCYAFVDARHREEVGSRTLSAFGAFLEGVGVMRENMHVHVVRSVGPCRYQVCLDIAF